MKNQPSETLRGILWMISSAGIFSLMSALVRIADRTFGVNAWQTSLFRFIISIAVILIVSVWMRAPLKFVNLPWLFSRGFFGGAAVCIYFYSITRIGLAKAAILTYSYPLWAGLLAPLLLKDRISLGLWIAVVTAFVGLYLIIVPAEGLGSMSWFDLLALFGGLLSGWAILSIKKLHETDSSRAILFSQCFFGLLIVAVPAQSSGYAYTGLAWITIMGVGLCAAAAQLLMTHAYKFIGATEGSLLRMLTPVINVWLGLLLFHEPVSMRMLIGCIVVILSCVYAALPQPMPGEGAGV